MTKEEQLENFLKMINRAINKDNSSMVIGNVVNYNVDVLPTSKHFCDVITIDLRKFSTNPSFLVPNIKTVRFFFKQYQEIISSYIFIAKEILDFKMIFQNDEEYNLQLTKVPSEIEIKDKQNQVVSVIKFYV